jgi:TPR repeat protein
MRPTSLRNAADWDCLTTGPLTGAELSTLEQGDLMNRFTRLALLSAGLLIVPMQSALGQVSKEVDDFLAVSGSLRNNAPVYKGTTFEKGMQAYELLRWKDARGFFETAARGGNGDAQFYLGMMYLNGEGGEESAQEALKWLRQAARKEVPEAENLLGVMYADGNGVTADPAEAARWFRLAAGRGYGISQQNLGSMYLDGTGVPKDEREAARLYRLAAEQNIPSAQGLLAELHMAGVGVAKDLVQAAKWLLLAGNAGDEEAFFFLDSLLEDGTLSEEQVEKASEEADAWLEARDE